MITGIERRHIRGERLRRADVAGGLLAADVLFARAEGETQRGLATRSFGNADNAARHLAFKFIARGEERRMRSTIAERHTKTLRAADSDVRAEFAGWLDER